MGVSALILLLSAPRSTYSETPLPEYYGVYALDRGALTELGKDTSEEKRRNFSGGVSILVFSKNLSNPMIPQEKAVLMTHRVFVRNEIEMFQGKGGAETSVSAVERFDLLEELEEIEGRFKPVKGEDEMLIFSPKKPLTPGLYAVLVAGQGFEYEGYPLAVALGAVAEKDSTLNGCVDQYFETFDSSSNPWGAFAIQSQSGMGTRTTIHGHTISKRDYRPCAEMEANLKSAKAGAVTATGQPTTAAGSSHVDASQLEAIQGTWTGTVQQDKRISYRVKMTVNGSEGGENSGTIEYPTIGCSGALRIREAGGGKYTFSEEIEKGKCGNGGTIKVSRREADDKIQWEWFGTDGKRGAFGELTRGEVSGNSAGEAVGGLLKGLFKKK